MAQITCVKPIVIDPTVVQANMLREDLASLVEKLNTFVELISVNQPIPTEHFNRAAWETRLSKFACGLLVKLMTPNNKYPEAASLIGDVFGELPPGLKDKQNPIELRDTLITRLQEWIEQALSDSSGEKLPESLGLVSKLNTKTSTIINQFVSDLSVQSGKSRTPEERERKEVYSDFVEKLKASNLISRHRLL